MKTIHNGENGRRGTTVTRRGGYALLATRVRVLLVATLLTTAGLCVSGPAATAAPAATPQLTAGKHTWPWATPLPEPPLDLWLRYLPHLRP